MATNLLCEDFQLVVELGNHQYDEKTGCTPQLLEAEGSLLCIHS